MKIFIFCFFIENDKISDIPNLEWIKTIVRSFGFNIHYMTTVCITFVLFWLKHLVLMYNVNEDQKLTVIKIQSIVFTLDMSHITLCFIDKTFVNFLFSSLLFKRFSLVLVTVVTDVKIWWRKKIALEYCIDWFAIFSYKRKENHCNDDHIQINRSVFA